MGKVGGLDAERTASMRHHSVQATRLVHEQFGTVMSFAYSRLPLQQLVEDKFKGEWKYLHRALFDIPEERATRALIELGLYIRVIDDDEAMEISKYYGDRATFGEVVQSNDSRGPLQVREVGNKIIHAERYEWRISAGSSPAVVCFASKGQATRFNWKSASIDLVALGAFCGQLMS